MLIKSLTNKPLKIFVLIAAFIVVAFLAYHAVARFNPNRNIVIGEKIDQLNGVSIYYNGEISNSVGRNVSKDGYNIGIKYQCVEFVKRYYFERFGHKMPDTYGHAKDFYDSHLKDGEWNAKRALFQYANGSVQKPKPDDIMVFGPSIFNQYGHVAIVANVNGSEVEIAQQNPGPFGSTREIIFVEQRDNKWFIQNSRVLGWLSLSDEKRVQKN